MRDRATFKERVALWMRELVHAVVSVQESAVTEFPRLLRCSPAEPADLSPKLAPLPFGPNERGRFFATGDPETATAEQAERSTKGLKAGQPLHYFCPDKEEEDEQWPPAMRADLPLRNDEGAEVDKAKWQEEHAESAKGLWSKPLDTWASGRVPQYRLGETGRGALQQLRQALPSDEWIREICHDARDLVIGCAVHVCSNSCFKYHSKGKLHICRHNFFHVAVLCGEEAEQLAHVRRPGKALRGCIGIFRETKYGMAGRVITFQMHPGECPTNYAGLVAMRCNVDVQDLRRVLPPELWMDPSELEPDADDAEYAHGAYPQRFRDISAGPQENWGWFSHLGTTEHYAHTAVAFTDWHKWFKELESQPGDESGRPLGPQTPSDDAAGGAPQEDASSEADDEAAADGDPLSKAGGRAALAMFVDAHNTGYYINSYTTKLNPTMDTVLEKLLAGVTRLKEEWREADAAAQDGDGTGAKKKAGFGRTMQLIARFETSFRRASWKSGSEMIFPMLFGHLSFTTHRCWTVYVRKAMWLAGEAWRQAYGQSTFQEVGDESARVQYIFKDGVEVTLPAGWRRTGRDGSAVYESPEGVEYDSLEFLEEQLQQGRSGQASAATSAATGALSNFCKHLQEGAVEDGGTDGGAPPANEASRRPPCVALSQLDDWLHRGTHPIVRDMNLYVYSMWVYRAEKNRTLATTLPVGARAPAKKHVEIEFDAAYPSRDSFTQRLAWEPRVPMVEGMQFVSDSNPEVHYMLQAILFRPIYLPPAAEDESKQQCLLRAYRGLCTPTNPEETWPAQNTGSAGPGPFQRGWDLFAAEQEAAAREAQRKTRRATGVCSLWRTAEVRELLETIADEEDEDRNDRPSGSEHSSPTLPSVNEYIALVSREISSNFTCIGRARTEPRQRREADDAVAIPEAFADLGGAGDDGEADGQVESAAARAQAGLVKLGEDLRIRNPFPKEELEKILSFTTADRTQRFVKELMATDLMGTGELPPPEDRGQALRARQHVAEKIEGPYSPLAGLGEDLKDLVESQRKLWKSKVAAEAVDPGCPPEPAAHAAGRSSKTGPEPQAYFAPGPEFQRPSDYVARLAKRFEEDGDVKRTLKRDQTLFLAQFAAACNAVWDDELEGKPAKSRKTFQMLLMGQGGSGKTALIQEIVLPAMDFLFPPKGPSGRSTSKIVCAKWSQAENISTASHRATTCHKAAQMGIGEHRNAHMVPTAEVRRRLEEAWCDLRLLVIEEVSMVSPNLFNMLLYRGFHARRQQCDLEEAQYQTPACAFGRVPIVIYLGDFLQLKPTGSGRSLLSDLQALGGAAGAMGGPPVEHQSAMGFFCATALCFELQATNRFKDQDLKDLMNFMRAPKRNVPASVASTWKRIQVKKDDPRLRQERFQNGHMLAWFWDTVARWVMMRAKRDARTLDQVLYLVQAADQAQPSMPRAMAAKLMNKVNPSDTGGMHGMLPLHLGMRVRLLEHLDLDRGLVKDAEGTVVHVAINPLDAREVDAAKRQRRPAYLTHMPYGVWVRMDKYAAAPFGGGALGIDGDQAGHLIFVEPMTTSAFDFRGHKVVRTSLPLSHAQAQRKLE